MTGSICTACTKETINDIHKANLSVPCAKVAPDCGADIIVVGYSSFLQMGTCSHQPTCRQPHNARIPAC